MSQYLDFIDGTPEAAAIQNKTFTRWINSFLPEVDKVQDLFTDLCDGIKLIRLCEILFNTVIASPNTGSERSDHFENVAKLVIYLHYEMRIKHVPSADIFVGKESSILKLVWSISLHYYDQGTADSKEQISDEKYEAELLAWCQKRIHHFYPCIAIHDFRGSWKSGLGFLALIHSYRPTLFSYNDRLKHPQAENLNLAFDIAFREFGVARLLDSQDFDCPVPDKKSVILYLSSLRKVLMTLKSIDTEKSTKLISVEVGTRCALSSTDSRLNVEAAIKEESQFQKASSSSAVSSGNSKNTGSTNGSNDFMDWATAGPSTSKPLSKERGCSNCSVDPPEDEKTRGAQDLINWSSNTEEDFFDDSNVFDALLNGTSFDSSLTSASTSFLNQSSKPVIMEEITIERKEPEGFGMLIEEGKEVNGKVHCPEGIFIYRIVRGGVAERDGRLEVGMRLLEVDGKPLLGVSQSDAVETLRNCGPITRFLVCREANEEERDLNLSQQQDRGKLVVYGTARDADLIRQAELKAEKEALEAIMVARREEEREERLKMEADEQAVLQLEQALRLEEEEARAVKEELVRERLELYQCECCYSDDVPNVDVVSCPEGHLFCRDCVKKATEVAFGDGRVNFKCLTDCDSHFSTNILKDIVDKTLYNKIELKIQEYEVRKANIEGLCICPFCEYAEILPEDVSVLNCKLCLKNSCRLCQEKDHSPLTCQEHKDKQNTSARAKIEAKMTEALLRECYKCKKKFIKQEGCNKMQCVCGALMCYICRQPITNYNHFSDNNRRRRPSVSGKCPLWSNNSDLHVNAVIEAARTATREVENEGVHFEANDFLKGLR